MIAKNLTVHRTKAVTVGAVSFYVDNFAKGVSKSTYGVLCHIPYNPLDPEHIKREHNLRLNLAGDKKVPRCFEPMLSRVRYSPPLSTLRDNFIVL